MADEFNKDAKRTWRRIFSIFNVSDKTPTNLQPSPAKDAGAPLPKGAFSDQELQFLPGFAQKEDAQARIQDIEKYFHSTSDRVAEKTKAVQKFLVLTPEIGKAKMVLVPTIMSPNDVQTDSISITIDTDEIEPDAISELSSELTDYFNDKLKLSSKVAKWIGEALFESGAKPVLILPRAPIKLLAEAAELEKELTKRGEVLDIGMESYEAISENIATEDLFDITGFSSIANDDTLDLDIEDAIFSTCSQFDIEKEKLSSSIEAMTKAAKNNKAKLKEQAKDIFTFTTDYRSIVASKDTSNKQMDDLKKKIAQSLYGNGGERLFIACDEGDINNGDHPTLIPLPAESVMPVAIPGDPSSHLGYFILTDEMGNPIDKTGTGEAPSQYNSKESSGSCSDVASATTNKGVEIIYGGKFGANGLSKNQQFAAASSVFGITVKKMLENKLRDNGLEGVTLKQHQSIMTTLFQRLIRKNKVRIVFVPSTLIAYYAFDYRSDGTGKTILEDSSFLISLRTTMVMANILTAIKNSTDRTRIEFDVGNQATNVDQLLDTIKHMFVEKRMLNVDHDPLVVARDIIQKSVSIVPKGIRGLDSLDVTTEQTGGNGSTQPDTEMMDKLSELVTLSMNIPPSALNRLSEDEYSRSIATTNLFFANDIRIRQQVVISITTQLVRQYIQTSKPLIETVIRAMKMTSKDKETDIDSKGETVTDKNLNEQDNNKLDELETKLYKVINSIKVTLPTPNLAATKAQYEELREAVDVIDSLVNRLFDEETIGIDDNDTKEAYGAIKGFVRQEVLRKIASSLGPHGAIDIPALENIDQDEVADFNQIVVNFKHQLKSLKHNLDKTGDDDAGGSRW